MYLRFSLILLILLLFFSSVYSQPEISSVDGDAISNGTITLSGTGFGEKAQAAPIIYDFTSFAYVNGEKNFSQSVFENGDLAEDYYGNLDSNSLWNEGGTVYYRYDLVPRVLDVEAHYLGVGANSRIGNPRMYKMDAPEVSNQLYVSWWFKPKIDPKGWYGFTLLGTNVTDFIINETIFLKSDSSVGGRIFAVEESTNRIFVEAENSMKLDSLIDNSVISSESSIEFTVPQHIYDISNVSGDFQVGDEFMLNSTGDVGEITYIDTQKNKMAGTFSSWVPHRDFWTSIRNLRTNGTLRITNYHDSYDGQGSSKYIRIWEDGWGQKGFRFSWNQRNLACSGGSTYVGSPAEVIPRKWNLMEAVVDLNRNYSMYTNGELVGTSNTSDCRKFDGNYNPTIALMGFNGKQDKQGWEMGEIYMDNTLQRIVISNSSTWNPSEISYYEIQMPKTWDDTEVSFNLRQGQFDDSDELYAYVFDEVGEVNQEGFKITGETQDTSDDFSCADIYSNDPNIFFCDGFETADLRSTNNGNFDWRDMMRTSIVTMDDEGPVAVYNKGDIFNRPSSNKNWSSLSGNYSMRFRYPAGQPMAEQRFNFNGNGYEELWWSFWVRVPHNFKHGTANNKLFRLWMDGYSQNGEGSTVGMSFRPNGAGGSNFFAKIGPGDFSGVGGDIGSVSFIETPQDNGKWMNLVVHVKSETQSDAQDGVMEVWRKWENDLEYSKTHNLKDLPVKLDSTVGGFQAGYLMGWANDPYEEETEWLIDNVVFSNSSLLYLFNSTTSSEEDTSTTPVVNFETSKNEIVYRGMFNLSWNVMGADSCNGFGDWKGEKPMSGSQEVSIIFDSTYVLNCSNENGDTLKEISVNVSDKIVPEVSQISGSLIDGSTIRVEGNNFGQKEQAEPVLWVFGSDVRENGIKVENYSYKIGDNVTKYDNGIWGHVDKRILFDSDTRYNNLVHSFYITKDGTLRNPTAFNGKNPPYSDSIYVSARFKPMGNLDKFTQMAYNNLKGEFDIGENPYVYGEEIIINSSGDIATGNIINVDEENQRFTFIMVGHYGYYPNATVTGLQSGATLQFDKDNFITSAGASKYLRMWSGGRGGMYSTLAMFPGLIVGYRDENRNWDTKKPINDDGSQDRGYGVADLSNENEWILLQNFISQKGTIMYNYIDVDNSNRRYLLDMDVGDKKYFDRSPTISQIGIDAAGGRKEVKTSLYLNEIYFDKSFQRVMLSNYSQFNQTGNELEIQYLTSWDEHDVEFELRLGALNEEDDLYLYLFNEYDVVNEQGYLLDFEESDAENNDGDSSDDDPSQDDDSNDNSGGGNNNGGSGSPGSSSRDDAQSDEEESSRNDVAYEAPVCQSDFSYSAWSSCVNGTQFRIVTDENTCVDSTQETRICRVGADENELKELNAKEVQLAKINNRRYETSFSDSYNEMVFTNEKLEDETFVVVDSATKQQYLGTLVDQKEGKYYYTLDRIDQNNLNTLKEQGLAERSFTESASSVFENFKNSRNFFSVLVILTLFGITTLIYIISRYIKKLHRTSSFE